MTAMTAEAKSGIETPAPDPDGHISALRNRIDGYVSIRDELRAELADAR